MTGMSWKEKLDKLNEALSLTNPIKGFGSGVRYDVVVDNLPIAEQI